jgi:hypothetical protein
MDDINERGNRVEQYSLRADRYFFDFEECKESKGWEPFDTAQDAWHFGVWLHPGEREINIYSDGEVTLIKCPTDQSYLAELNAIATLYGPTPAASNGFDEGRHVTEYFDEQTSI